MVLYAMRFTTSLVSYASTRIGGTLASFLHRLLGGRGIRAHIVISDAAVGHTLVDIVVNDPSRRHLVESAARQDLSTATHAERRKETHYRDRASRTKFVFFALETHGALSDRSNRFLVECAPRECNTIHRDISMFAGGLESPRPDMPISRECQSFAPKVRERRMLYR